MEPLRGAGASGREPGPARRERTHLPASGRMHIVPDGNFSPVLIRVTSLRPGRITAGPKGRNNFMETAVVSNERPKTKPAAAILGVAPILESTVDTPIGLTFQVP